MERPGSWRKDWDSEESLGLEVLEKNLDLGKKRIDC